MHKVGLAFVFENPEHDFPQRVLCWRDGANLCARIEGTQKGKPGSQEWCWKPMKSRRRLNAAVWLELAPASYNEHLLRKARTRRSTSAQAAKAAPAEPTSLDVYREMWMALSPAERLRRSWRLRLRLKNIEAVHDDKYLPEL